MTLLDFSMQACFHVGQEERVAEGPKEPKWKLGGLLQPALLFEIHREWEESPAGENLVALHILSLTLSDTGC